MGRRICTVQLLAVIALILKCTSGIRQREPRIITERTQGRVDTTLQFLPPGEDLQTRAMTAIRITYNISFEYRYCSECVLTSQSCCPVLEIYTHRRFYINPEAKCEDRSDTSGYDKWTIVLKPDDEKSGCYRNNQNEVTCGKEAMFGLGVPRTFGFTFSSCNSRVGIHLNYSIDFEDIAGNASLCQDMIPAVNEVCAKTGYSKVMFPGEMGYTSQREAMRLLGEYSNVIFEAVNLCHQQASATICRTGFPECQDGRRIFPCREQCEEVINACPVKAAFSASRNLKVYCDTFASYGNGTPCYYEPVRCDNLTNPQNGFVNISTNARGRVARYTCVKGYSLTTEALRNCSARGSWSGADPKCVKERSIERDVTVSVTLLAFGILIAVVILILVRKRHYFYIKFRKVNNIPLQRDYKYDVFISYSSLDDEFAEVELLDYLETVCDPPVRVCLHGRDFLPGEYIISNISSAIEESVACFILLSRNYISSAWCVQEFTMAYSRMITDQLPGCTLQVILLDDLRVEEMPPEMRGFCQSITYLKWTDPKFWNKVRAALKKVQVTDANVKA